MCDENKGFWFGLLDLLPLSVALLKFSFDILRLSKALQDSSLKLALIISLKPIYGS
jgi:hypothetical protein